MATSRSESPIKQTFKKLLSPTKPKPPPVLAVQAPDLRNSSYPESTSSSNYSQDSANSSSNGGFTGWNVFERPGTPTFDANKENVNVTPKQIVNHVMGRKPSKKLRKGNTKSTSVLKNSKHDVDLDRQFEELMNSRSIPSELRCKLRTVDPSVKLQMLKSQSSLSHSPHKSPSKLFKIGSSADLHASPKKAKKYSTIAVPVPVTKAHPAAVFTEGKVWDVDMQGVTDVRAYFCGIKVNDIDVGMVKKLWQLLRNESMEWIQQFLKEDGFGMLTGVLKDVLAIEWRDEKDDAVLHQLLLCLKALSTTEAGLHELSVASPTILPLLINNLFSDKQPTEFSTRLLTPHLVLSHLAANPNAETATTILCLLSDQKADTKPHEFLLESYTPRPYKKWYSEIHSVCRDAFWIFLHPRNVIPLAEPYDLPFPHSAKITAAVPSGFKGGVEWYATEYLSQHMALLNGLLAALPMGKRMELRQDLRNCGFEYIMGGKLRKASREYYPGLHAELQRWCWEGHKDGWNVFDVARGVGGVEIEEMPVADGIAEKKNKADGELEFPGGS